ncbi:hypothetical protein BGZ74_006936 [Mortierella antarctica]|nr:hypothetical protein BGZ74_006936 [Mortierella antarctica]
MSKDVRRLFAAQKAAKAGSPSLAASAKKVTHPLAKYDPKTMRLSCAICGPAVPIKSDSLWNAHLVSKAHQEAVAKLRAVKEQMQKRELAEAERAKLQQQQQQQIGVKRKAGGSGGGGGGLGGLVAYDDSESESEEEEESAAEPKRAKIEEQDQQPEPVEMIDSEDEEDVTAGLPAGFFDSSSGVVAQESADPEAEEPPAEGDMEGVLPAGFFDDPEEDARIRAEVGGATADLQQRQLDAEFKALQAELAKTTETQDQPSQQRESGQEFGSAQQNTVANADQTPYDAQKEPEDEELEESVLARIEEEYQLFVEMQERLEALRMKKERITAQGSAPTPTTPTTIPKPKAKSSKQKSILDVVREQEQARKEKERQAAAAFAKLKGSDDSKMASDDDDEEDSEDDEDIEAMMDWRAKRV